MTRDIRHCDDDHMDHSPHVTINQMQTQQKKENAIKKGHLKACLYVWKLEQLK